MKKKLVVMKRMVNATKKSTLKSIRKDVVARTSVALSGETAKKEREIVRGLSLESQKKGTGKGATRRSVVGPVHETEESLW